MFTTKNLHGVSKKINFFVPEKITRRARDLFDKYLMGQITYTDIQNRLHLKKHQATKLIDYLIAEKQMNHHHEKNLNLTISHERIQN